MAAKPTPADQPGGKAAGKADQAAPPPKRDGARETMESVAVAFIFCFLFKTFEAEAFVIPTGSMAPTLYGRHKDVECPGCGFEWAVGASTEVDDGGYLYVRDPDGPRGPAPPEPANPVRDVKCPNCALPVDLAPLPPFAGDRILVNKWPFVIGDPDRWDVTVFKFPENPTTNYVKRLVGLPGETVTIRQGDVYTIDRETRAAAILKKAPAKQRAMTLPVYEHDRPAPELLEAGVPERFAPVVYRGEAAGPEAVAGWADDPGGWAALPDSRALRRTPVAGTEYEWVRYRHLRPTAEQWQLAAAGVPVKDVTAKLILDYCGYNPDKTNADGTDDGVYWVGDLELSLTLETFDFAPDAGVLLELVEGDRTYRCRIDPATGAAAFSLADTLAGPAADDPAADSADGETVLGEYQTEMVGPGEYELVFANVDDRLTLWVDGDPIAVADYPPFAAVRVQEPTERDFTPAGFAVKNLSARASRLTLRRDLYYRGSFRGPDTVAPSYRETEGSLGVPVVFHDVDPGRVRELAGFADDPDYYGPKYREHLLADRPDADPRVFELTLDADEYLMLGDNSPSSLDSRLWANTRGAPRRHAVPRDALVGTAFAIYWPHGEPVWFPEAADLDGDGEADESVVRGWAAPWVPVLNRWLYHVGRDGRLVTSYQAHGLPFLPKFERLFKRIR